MVNELVAIVAILAAEAGAILSVVKGWWNAPDNEPFNHKKLGSALITSALAALGLVSFNTLPDPTSSSFLWIGVIVQFLVTGWGVDKILSGLDK